MGKSKNMNLGMPKGILETINKKSSSVTNVVSNISSDNISDINSDTISDNVSDTSSDVNSSTVSDIANIVKKKDKYTDVHARKTYYIEKELLKKIDKLCDKNNLDKSFVVNEALRFFFNEIEKAK